jgi:hypothetical protein
MRLATWPSAPGRSGIQTRTTMVITAGTVQAPTSRGGDHPVTIVLREL